MSNKNKVINCSKCENNIKCIYRDIGNLKTKYMCKYGITEYIDNTYLVECSEYKECAE